MLDAPDANFEEQNDAEGTQGRKGPAARGLPAAPLWPKSERPDENAEPAREGKEAKPGDSLPLLPFTPSLGGAYKSEPWRPERKGMAKGLSIAAGLFLFAALGAAAAYDHWESSRALSIAKRQDHTLETNIAALKSRIDSVEGARSHDEVAGLRQVLSELKTGAASAHDLNAALAQLSARVDHIEKDQGARLDRLGDRIDHDAAVRLADVVARLDRLEKKPAPAAIAPASAVAAAPPPPLPTTLKTLPAPKPEVAKAELGVSNETTGAIEKPKPRLRNYYIAGIRNDSALIEGPGGAQSVRQGDYVPGAGRVLRLERHGYEWAVVTTQGVIVNEPDRY